MIRRLSLAVLAASSIAVVAPNAARADDIAPGDFRVVKKGEAKAYEGNAFKAENKFAWRGAGARKVKVTWGSAGKDDFGNDPVKYILLFSKHLSSPANNPFLDETTSKAWFEGNGEQQADYFIECGTGVHSMLDLNESGDGYWSNLWIVVEYSNGKRKPFSSDDIDIHTWISSDDPSTLPANTIKVPEDYAWPSSGGGNSGGDDAPKAEALTAGHFKHYHRGHAPKWKGEVWNCSDQLFGWRGAAGRKVLVTWGEAGNDDFGNKPVKYLLFFSRKLSSPAQNPWRTGESTQAWFDLKDTQEQADYYFATATDIHTLVDKNDDTSLKGYWSNMWVVVEYSNGKRAPFQAPDIVTYSGQKYKNAVVIPEDYKWKVGAEPKPPIHKGPTCPACGAGISEGAKKCDACGKVFGATPPPPPPPQPAPPPPPKKVEKGICPGCGNKVLDPNAKRCPACDTPLPQ